MRRWGRDKIKFLPFIKLKKGNQMLNQPFQFTIPEVKESITGSFMIQPYKNKEDEYCFKCATPWDKIAVARWIVKHKQYARVIELNEIPEHRTDGDKGAIFDLFSAQVACQVYDALSEKNKKKAVEFNLGFFLHLAFGAINKCSAR
jgi:hypothetical protein